MHSGKISLISVPLAAAWCRLCLSRFSLVHLVVLLITCLLKPCCTCKVQNAPFRYNTPPMPPDNCLQFVSVHYLHTSISFNQLEGYCDDVYWTHILENVKRNSECEGFNRPWYMSEGHQSSRKFWITGRIWSVASGITVKPFVLLVALVGELESKADKAPELPSYRSQSALSDNQWPFCWNESREWLLQWVF